MRKILFGFALALLLAPIAAFADPTPAPAGPPPDVRAKMEAARADTKAALVKALSADHMVKVQAVIDGFNAGTTAPPDAIASIDAILSPDETKAVIGIGEKFNETRRSMMPPGAGPGGPGGPGAGPGAPGAGPGGAPPGAMPPNGDQGRRGPQQPDAGRTLLQFFASPDKLRAMRRPGT